MIRLFSGRSGYLAGNAGDEVSAPLLRALTGRPVQVMAEPEAADLFAAGSILDKLPPSSAAYVWGSGLIREDDRVDAPRARPLALRGPLTARRWPGCPDVPFGDPGILVSSAWEPRVPTKRWRLGIVPHYADERDTRITLFARRWQEDVTVIAICGHVETVCAQISDCEYILSSSLHGMVFSDSYGVPNGRLVLSENIAGGSFKFRDYIGAFGIHDPINAPFDGSETVQQMRDRIDDTWDPRRARGIREAKAGLLEALRKVEL